MGMPDMARKWTREMVLALPDDGNLQLGGGQRSQPDLFVVASLPTDLSWDAFPNPILIVEILSPSSASFDRTTKRRRFQRAGIPEYWLVDLDARTVERWRPEDQRPEILDDRLIWAPPGAETSLEIDLRAVFQSIGARQSPGRG